MALKMCLRIWTLLMLVLAVVNLSHQSEQPNTNGDVLSQILGKLDQIDSKLGQFDTKIGNVDSRLTNLEYGLKQMYNTMLDINTDLPAMTGRSSDTLVLVRRVVEEIDAVKALQNETNDKLGDLKDEISGDIQVIKLAQNDTVKDMHVFSDQLSELKAEIFDDFDILKITNNDTTNELIEVNEKLDIIYAMQNESRKELLNDLNFIKNNTMKDMDKVTQKIDILNDVQNISYQENNRFKENILEDMTFVLMTQSNITKDLSIVRKQGHILNSMLNKTGYEVDNFNENIYESVKILKEIQAYTSEQHWKTVIASIILSTGGYKYDGSLIIPLKIAAKMTWEDSMSHCQDLGAQPFVPKTRQDFEIIKKVRTEVGSYLWLPASDTAQEGALKWWNGEDASGSPGIIWQNSEEMYGNSDTRDCVGYGSHGVHMWTCSSNILYPMICSKMN